MKSASSTKKQKRALLYNPYLDVIGGGERHILSVMEILAQAGYKVDIAWDNEKTLKDIEQHLRMDVSYYSLVPNVFQKNSRSDRDRLTEQYDVLIYVTDGSYFMSKAQRNVIFSMYPSKQLYKKYPTNWLKLRSYELITNGDFTAEMVSKWLGKKAFVIYPYIHQELFVDKAQKRRTILGVGRFFRHLHSKRHDILINAFTKLQHEYREFADFNLVLVGGLKSEDKAYFNDLQSLAKINKNITFRPNASFTELKKLYKDSMIYWHAAGFDSDEKKNPERVEHVGISPLEAMASKCLTFCHDSGGPKRYITQGQNGYLYSSLDDLVSKTAVGYRELQKNERIIDNAKLYVGTHFSYPVFKNKVEQFFRL